MRQKVRTGRRTCYGTLERVVLSRAGKCESADASVIHISKPTMRVIIHSLHSFPEVSL